MSLQAIYERFLADPNPSVLGDGVSLNYITTTTAFSGADAVLKHLTSQQRIVKKKSDKTLSAIESPNALVLDVEATVEFVSGGGAYLPNLDDNFLADRVATFPTIHIVRFDSQNHIQQIKLYWDQGSLLKQVDVIGARGRNWPIRDAKDQTRLITSTASGVVEGPVSPPSQPKVAKDQEPAQFISPSKKHIKDPHTSLSLFSSDEPPPAAIAPRAAASGKPPTRAYNELFVGEDDTPTKNSSQAQGAAVAPKAGGGKNYHPIRLFDDYNETTTAEEKSTGAVAPKAGGGKNFHPIRLFDDYNETTTTEEKPTAAVPPKAGSNKNFHAIRLFDDDETDAIEEKPKPTIHHKAGASKNFQPIRLFDDDETVAAEKQQPLHQTDPNKYGHFDIGNEEDGQQGTKPIPSRPKQRPLSNWDFADFATPEKPRNTKVRGQDVRHFGWSDNEDDLQETPAARPHVPHPRRDAERHFQIEDDGVQGAGSGAKRIIGAAHNAGLGLYKNNLYDEEGNPTPNETGETGPAGVNPNETHRKKDFDSHWSITDAAGPDEQPEAESRPAIDRPVEAGPTGVHPSESHRKKDFDSHWSITDASPPEDEQHEQPKFESRSDHAKVLKMMDSSWDSYDQSPEPPKEHNPLAHAKRVSRNVNQRSWGFGDEGGF